ncbi:MAG: hypothetical protein H6Q84_614, partial [Deltaproteobacteria bacterium]|nr:hypothetical protein [Deltaproteobacteria bacterium]
MTPSLASRAAALIGLLLLSAAAGAEVPQPPAAGSDSMPVPRPGLRDSGRTVPIAPFLRAESDFAAGRKEEALRGFLDIAYSGPEDERKGYVWMRVGELLVGRGELDKALEAADKAVRLSRARYLALAAMDLKLLIYQKMDWTNEARQMAGYLIDQKYVDADVPSLLALMARADARAGKIGSALELYRRAVSATTNPEAAIGLSSERESLIEGAVDLAALREAGEAEGDPDVRSHLFLALGRAAARKGFYGMATYAFERSIRAFGKRSKESAEGLFRIEKIVSERPKIVGLVPLSGKLADLGFSVLSGAEVALAPGRVNGQAGGTPVIRWVDT